MKNLNSNVLVDRVANAAAAAQTEVDSDSVDMSGFNGVRFIALLGAVSTSGVPKLKVQQSSDDGVADGWSDIEGSGAAATDADDNKLLMVDVKFPQKRYLRAALTRTGGDCVLDGIIAEKYGASLAAVTQPSDVKDSHTLVSPAEGTA